jgi:hypothetical protein
MKPLLFQNIDQNTRIEDIKLIVKKVFQAIIEEGCWLNEFFLHPLGFYYSRLYYNDSNQIRLHIWEPGYPVKEDLFIHDHFYDLCSWVLCGEIVDYIYSVEPSEEPTAHTLFTSSYLANKNVRTLTRTNNYQKVKLIRERRINKNEKYYIPKGTFHSNKILFRESNITATIVFTLNHNKDNSPNVIGLSSNQFYSENDPIKIEPNKVKNIINAAIVNIWP